MPCEAGASRDPVSAVLSGSGDPILGGPVREGIEEGFCQTCAGTRVPCVSPSGTHVSLEQAACAPYTQVVCQLHLVQVPSIQ